MKVTLAHAVTRHQDSFGTTAWTGELQRIVERLPEVPDMFPDEVQKDVTIGFFIVRWLFEQRAFSRRRGRTNAGQTD